MAQYDDKTKMEIELLGRDEALRRSGERREKLEKTELRSREVVDLLASAGLELGMNVVSRDGKNFVRGTIVHASQLSLSSSILVTFDNFVLGQSYTRDAEEITVE